MKSLPEASMAFKDLSPYIHYDLTFPCANDIKVDIVGLSKAIIRKECIIMALSLLLAEKIASLFLMSLAGFILVKLKVFKSSDSRYFSLASTYIFIPAMVLKAFQIESTPDNIHDTIVLLVAAISIHVIYIVVTLLIRKPLHLSNVEQASLIYTNCGNLITPLVASIFGESLLFCPSVFALLQILIIWTHGYALVSGEKKRNLKNVFLNFNIIVALISLTLFATRIHLPNIIMETLNGLSNMMGPTGMLVIGMLIAGADLRDVLSKPRTFLLAALRLLLYPMIIILLFKAIGLAHFATRPEVLVISLLAAAAPSATTIINMAQIKNINAHQAASINIVSTLLCIFSMPLMIQIYQWLIH